MAYTSNRILVLILIAVVGPQAAGQSPTAVRPVEQLASDPEAQQPEVAAVKPLPPPLQRAHAHNDYAHERPLMDALDQGFCSVEADIFLVDGELQVGHTRFELRRGRTLESLYLRPLLERVRKNKKTHGVASVFKKHFPFTLLVDFKNEAEPTYRVLSKLLESYREMLTEFRDGEVIDRAVQIVLSGNRPTELLSDEKQRYAFIDGRLSDLGKEIPAQLMPLISDRWSSHFKWRGRGEMPAAEREKLHDIAKQTHASGKRLRFWATPETQAMWGELNAAGVDHINTDKLAQLAEFLSTN
ncbi:MAG: phosphatidylinositol-specific phospholipase C/glycerophosphodiester phosphodiesterase family protein [Aureliella sp.]